MIDFSNSIFGDFIIHKVGNKLRDEGSIHSESLIQIDDRGIENLLMNYFFAPFKGEEFYTFSHHSSLELNEVYSYSLNVFDDPSALAEISVHIANHLYESSTHPKVKGGELYIVSLNDCAVDGELVNAIGIFKSENKDTFLRVYPKAGTFEVEYEQGINISKLDKGALIFDTERDQGLKVCIVDNINKGKEAIYWKEDFLGVTARRDDFYQTRNYISLCTQFINDEEISDKIDEKDKIDLLTKSAVYFRDNDTFDEIEFKKEVLPNETFSGSFDEFKDKFETQNKVFLQSDFDINKKVVKEKSRQLIKSIMLDQNFKIQVFDNPHFMESGYDDNLEMSYYKLFFKDSR